MLKEQRRRSLRVLQSLVESSADGWAGKTVCSGEGDGLCRGIEEEGDDGG